MKQGYRLHIYQSLFLVVYSSPNVCVEREEIDESQHRNRTGENSGTDSDEEGGSIFGSFQFSSCQQTDVKYTCTTK